MEYYLLYKTTNLLNGRYYIGVHKAKTLEFDGYLGSGKLLWRAIRKHGKESFQRETLYVGNSYEEVLALEATIVTEELISDEMCYNAALGGGLPPKLKGKDHPHYGKKLEYASIRMKENNPAKGKFGKDSISYGKVSVRDSEGNTMRVDKTDPRYISGELVSVNKGKITVRDKDGNVFHVTKDDPRYISGELIHTTKNRVLTCPHCGKTGGNSMKRWHFNNCRDK